MISASNKFAADIQRLGPFAVLDIELEPESFQFKELCEIVDIVKVPECGAAQFETDMARIIITKTKSGSYIVNITRKPENILGYY